MRHILKMFMLILFDETNCIQSFSLTLFNFSEYSAQMSPLKGTSTFDNDKFFFFFFL